MDKLVSMLRAAGDSTRLRLLLLLRQAELTVSEIVDIIGQSQPRVSRHLKLLCDAGLLERFKEGSWVFYRASDRGTGAQFGAAVSGFAMADTEAHAADLTRLTRVREARAAEAAAYFKTNAAEWGRIRALHAPEKDVETAIVRHLTERPIENLLDAGTGTGRMLELLGGHAKRAVGLDISPEMLAIARDRLTRAGLNHCQVRLGDIYRPPFETAVGFDAVLFHQVLHYLNDPQTAVVTTARMLSAGGRVLIADFAPHQLEFLRTEYAHRRLGFTEREVSGWFDAAGLKPLVSETIAPPATSKGKLTVKIWMAAAPQTKGRPSA
ncbi:MAG: methyltransferase domain-containing protein [Rhodospirillaceae bacterium]|nr:MAG: methyltransferase domain-containing protein [Rhodospirillaceae bacterium]